jgi:hypothetical protein
MFGLYRILVCLRFGLHRFRYWQNVNVDGNRALTTFKLEGEVTSLSESSQGEVEDNREKYICVIFSR